MGVWRITTIGMALYAGVSTFSSTGWRLFLHGEPVGAAAGYAVRHVHALREAVRVTRRERPLHIDPWVDLPDHMHCVWTLPPRDDDFSNRWRAPKADDL